MGLWLLCLHDLRVWAADVAADEGRRVLTAKGLAPSNGLWVTPAELDLRRRLDGLEGLAKRAGSAHQLADAMLAQNELVRAQLRRAEAVEKQGNLGVTKSSGDRGSPTQPAAQPNSRQPDVTGAGEQSPLQAALIDWVNTRNSLELAVLDIQRRCDALDREYRQLANDHQVRGALARLAGAKLGPARDYRRNARLSAAAREVFTAVLPTYHESGRWRVTAVVDDRTVATFSFTEQEQPTCLSASLCQTLGLMGDATEPELRQRIGDRELPVRRGKVAALRLGKYVFRNVPVMLLPPEAEDLGSQLSAPALAGYRVRLVRERMSLELQPLSAAANHHRSAAAKRSQTLAWGPFRAAIPSLSVPEFAEARKNRGPLDPGQ